MIPPRIEGGDHPLWADEAEVQSVQRDSKTSQPPNVRPHLYSSPFFVDCVVAEIHHLQSSVDKIAVT